MGIKLGVIFNFDVYWDNIDKFNFGFDLCFFNNCLSVIVDVYYDINFDILNQNIGGIIGIFIFVGGVLIEVNFGCIDVFGSEFFLNWCDKIDQVKYNIGVNFGFNGNRVREWFQFVLSYIQENFVREGVFIIFFIYGYKVWRGISFGDGILWNSDDIENYWNYLLVNVEVVGIFLEYLGVKDVSQLKLGMLVYQDLGGVLNEDGMQLGFDGCIVKIQDYVKLNKSGKIYGFIIKLGVEWKGISFNMMIVILWGGYCQIDVNKIIIFSGDMFWILDLFWEDMFDERNNMMGKYFNLGLDNRILGLVIVLFDFWFISMFCCYICNLSIGYMLFKVWLLFLKIQLVKLSLIGNNLWDFYNLYFDYYCNMYCGIILLYFILRMWLLGVNVLF